MTQEFTHLVDLSSLAKSGKKLILSALPAQRRALAERLEVLEIKDFTATLAAKKQGRGVYRLEGRIAALLMQTSVRTMEPVENTIDEIFSVIFMRQDDFDSMTSGEENGGIEDIEIFGAENINVGEIAAQYLSLFVNPHPVGEGEALPAEPGEKVRVYSEQDHREKTSPFAALKNLDNKV